MSTLLSTLLALPMIGQAAAMFFDEFYFHHRRGLPKWERLGHPVDTISVLLALAVPTFLPFSITNLQTYLILALLSCVVITKDEWVHTVKCEASENWLHSLLFVLHPLVFLSIGLLWAERDVKFLSHSSVFLTQSSITVEQLPVILKHTALAINVQWGLAFVVLIYQIAYWNFFRDTQNDYFEQSAHKNVVNENKDAAPEINNTIYHSLGEDWYTATDDPVALLRAESRVKNPWVVDQIKKPGAQVLDVGCGAGFLSNYLAEKGFAVTGLDASAPSLDIARAHDSTKTVKYVTGDAYKLPFEDASFDVVCSMDFLEHVDNPEAVVKEISRVLKPGGQFFFHTFNRNCLARIFVIHAVEFFLKKTPKNLHVYRLFIKPKELKQYCKNSKMHVKTWVGLRPHFFSMAFFKSVLSFRVLEGFEFKFTSSLAISYMGCAEK